MGQSRLVLLNCLQSTLTNSCSLLSSCQKSYQSRAEMSTSLHFALTQTYLAKSAKHHQRWDRNQTQHNKPWIQGMSPGDAQWLHLVYNQYTGCSFNHAEQTWTRLWESPSRISQEPIYLSSASIFLTREGLTGDSSWESLSPVRRHSSYPAPLCSLVANSFSKMDRLNQSSTATD